VKELNEPYVRIDIPNLKEYIMSVVDAKVASLDLSTATPVATIISKTQLKKQEVTTNTNIDSDTDVVVSNLNIRTDKVRVSLPTITETKKMTFVARRGGMDIIPYKANNIDGNFLITIGVGEIASLVGSGSTATYIKKPIALPYETVELVNDGIDTWYII
jgi:hypothetical protein